MVVKTTSRGQATFRKEFFRHVGIKPGEAFEIDYLPGGEFRGRAAKKKGKIEDVFGMLKGKTDVKLTIDQMDQAIGEAVVEEFLRGVKR
jgi:bifunctional DNA-binding transcriptional regulator/antitoxin component of YhaV-PrlF toxin-antitoxin module